MDSANLIDNFVQGIGPDLIEVLFVLEGMRQATKILENIRFQSRDINPRFPENKTGLPATLSRS